MTILIVIVILGVAVGFFMNSLMDNRGSALGLPLSAGVGVIGSFITGMLFLMFGRFLVGEGPDFILSLFAAVVGAVILILLVAIVKKRVF
jgi:uncharacterized membrane protein YeaQ/YmgE (transglycosylase-associated protein family)